MYFAELLPVHYITVLRNIDQGIDEHAVFKWCIFNLEVLVLLIYAQKYFGFLKKINQNNKLLGHEYM